MVFKHFRSGEKSSADTDERRDFPRLSSSCLVDYNVVQQDDRYEEMRENSKGLLQNISGGGMCIRVEKAPEDGEMMTLNIRLPQFPTAVLALGKVCWVKTVEGGGFDVGVEFWWIGWEDAEAQESIRGYIRDCMPDKED